jgi:hypothetical protein
MKSNDAWPSPGRRVLARNLPESGYSQISVAAMVEMDRYLSGSVPVLMR